MGEAYFDRASVQRRLNNTICMYRGEPVYVTTEPRRAGRPLRTIREATEDVERSLRGLPPIPREAPAQPAPPAGANTIIAYKLPVDYDKPLYIDYTEPEFSYKAFPLGYMNMSGHAYYMYRVPSRQQAQGLEQHYLRYISTADGMYDSNYHIGQEMRDCILGVYPSFADAKSRILGYTCESVAFSRDTGIRRGGQNVISLLYRGREIGFLEKDRFRLIPGTETKALKYALRGKIEFV